MSEQEKSIIQEHLSLQRFVKKFWLEYINRWCFRYCRILGIMKFII
jgi:hypothetical protein